ncbi:Fic family protein [Rhizobium sp. RCAM05973]|uniref:Fic family protein n=1 Tax=Rhizobium sp. RCAM05973 TaxID=2994066 RepID=UPI0022EBF34C|nr:Fic family protein [Rhizobium sp. RCAM05973]
MPAPHELLATSLEELKRVTEEGTRGVIKSDELTRRNRERLLSTGFLEEIMRGWLAVNSRPSDRRRVDNAWSTVYWEFLQRYLDDRFGSDWCLSSETSIALWAENRTLMPQVVVRSPAANNQIISMPGNTSMFLLRVPKLDPTVEYEGMRLMSKEDALIGIAKNTWTTAQTDVISVVGSIRGSATLSRALLANGHSKLAGRIAGALRHLGRERDADAIAASLRAAGYNVVEENPLNGSVHTMLDERRAIAPAATRIRNMWAKMRVDVLDSIDIEGKRVNDIDGYMEEVEQRYIADALNSLSIEGYSVSAEFIERVRSGEWNPEEDANDYETRNALAAKGYRLAFEEVKHDIRLILAGEPSGELLWHRHQDWFRAMFQPSVTAGIIEAYKLAGYRSHNVYLRGSSHVPLPPSAIPDAMDALFDCIAEESDARVKALVAPFLFTYIHPFPDGNGRTGRFLMNALMAEAGLPWTVVPVDQRDRYMDCLEQASQHENIRPLALFIEELAKAPPPPRPEKSAWSAKY